MHDPVDTLFGFCFVLLIHGISHKEIWEKLNSDSEIDQLDLGL